MSDYFTFPLTRNASSPARALRDSIVLAVLFGVTFSCSEASKDADQDTDGVSGPGTTTEPSSTGVPSVSPSTSDTSSPSGTTTSSSPSAPTSSSGPQGSGEPTGNPTSAPTPTANPTSEPAPTSTTPEGGSGGAGGQGGDEPTEGMGGTAAAAGAGGEPASNGGSDGMGEVPEDRCDPALSAMNREIAGKALDELFIEKDVSAIDRYWAEPYLQHNPAANSGLSTFRGFFGNQGTLNSLSYERIRTFAECDLAIVQGRYGGTGVIFDMFRLKDGKLMEHWDSASGQASETSGPTEIDPNAPTAANRVLVLEMIDRVLIEGEHAAAAEFLSADYVEHHAPPGTGPAAFTGYLSSENISYTQVHHVIADGNFVFTLSEGSFGGTTYGFYDLFRVEGGEIVEHWDSKIRAQAGASGLGVF